MKAIIFGVLLILGACWFWYQLAGSPLAELALIRRARTAPGLIVDAWEDVEDGYEEAAWFHGAVYSYRLPDGREYKERTPERKGRLREQFREFEEPYPIEVEYLPENPAVSRIKGYGCQSVGEWLWRKAGLGSLLLAVFLGGGVILLRDGIREIKKSRASREHARGG